jgi:hypothetical protein
MYQCCQQVKIKILDICLINYTENSVMVWVQNHVKE